jgi:hypothetical protein
MTPFRALCVPLFALVALSGCAYRNNYPQTVLFPIDQNDPSVLRLYVDANGTFFPNKWQAQCPDQCKKLKRDFSLLVESLKVPPFRTQIVADEARQLDITRRYLASHRRIFILVHGFNSDEKKIHKSYALIRSRIALEPNDGVIEFYWDGLVKVPSDRAWSIAPLKFWRDAAINSQTGGARGLRRILALAQNRTLVLISHSRGASVVLSALSNPPYRAKFVKRMEQRDLDLDDGINGSPGFLSPAPLPAGSGNTIRLLMLAPAIGCIDFQRPDFKQQTAKTMSAQACANVRPLRVDFLGYTLNDKDRVLGKYIFPATWYNATDFGYKKDLGLQLSASENWGFMKSYLLKYPHRHDFDCYIADLEFGSMLKDAGASLNPTMDVPCTTKKPRHPKP